MKKCFFLVLISISGLLFVSPHKAEAAKRNAQNPKLISQKPIPTPGTNYIIESPEKSSVGPIDAPERTNQKLQISQTNSYGSKSLPKGEPLPEPAKIVPSPKPKIRPIPPKKNINVAVNPKPKIEVKPVSRFTVRPVPKPRIEFTEPAVAATPPEPEKLTRKIEQTELQGATFVCNVDNNEPATVLELDTLQKFPVIVWESETFTQAGYEPQLRCKQVTARLEEYKKEGKLIYLTTGKINGQSVLCLTDKENGDCGEGIPSHDGLLFTVQPSKNPEETLDKLVALLQREDATTQKPLKE